jgi:hypothetical protein
LIDNKLSLNYFITNALAYTVLPIVVIIILNKGISAEALGLKVSNAKKTVAYTVLGIIFASSIFVVTDHFFHQQWISGYTLDGLIMWISLVSIISVFLQTLFYAGMLFNRYIGKENTLLLGLIALFTLQSYVAPNSAPWLACNMLTVSSELFITWKTKNVYGAFLTAVAVGLIELSLQIL